MSAPTVFLSYASQDADAARRICDALRAAGLEVWFDQSELRGGDAWDASIRKQIKECSLFVPLISGNTNAREEGYFRLEWKLAVDRSHLMADDKTFFVPVILGDTLEPTARVPDAFRARQWSRLYDEQAIAAFAKRAVKLIAGSASFDGGTRTGATHNASPLSEALPRNAAPVLEFGVSAPVKKADDTPSIAVLAFANRSASADDEYFSDGLADELLNVLAKIKGLRVIARTSSFAFKGKSDDVATIGAKLNVATLLEGSVRKSGNRVRIGVQLVQVSDSAHLWSETYDRTLDDIFAVQDEIAQAVVTELRAALLGNVSGVSSDVSTSVIGSTSHLLVAQTVATAQAAATFGRTSNSEAHRLRLQGRSLFLRSSYDDRRAAIPLFERAAAIDPSYAGAWADLSFALYWLSASAGAGKTPVAHDYWQGYKAAQSAADRASALEPNLPEALLARATIARIVDLNQRDALQWVRQAVQLAPSDVLILRGAATLIGDNGYLDEALGLARRALELDPISLQSYATAAALEAEVGNLAEAESLFRIGCTMATPELFFPRFGLFVLLLTERRFDECEAMLPQWSIALHRDLPGAMLAWAKGDIVASNAMLDRIKYAAAALACYQIAQAHAYRHEADETFTWLEKCIELRDAGVFNVKTDQLFDFLHNDPRWLPIMRTLGFEG